MTGNEKKPESVSLDVPRPDRQTTDGLEKKGYSPPPVAQVQRPKPPPAGPRQRPAASPQPRAEKGKTSG